jgi:protein-disulfide isomerase
MPTRYSKARSKPPAAPGWAQRAPQKRAGLREIMGAVSIGFRPLRVAALVFSLAVLGCRAQTAPPAASPLAVQPGVSLTAEEARRVEVMIRSRSQMQPDYVIGIGQPTRSDVPGYVQIVVTFSANGNTSRPIPFLLSYDGKTLAQFNKFDLSQDPREKISAVGRPARGGPENAPVLIVGFDDLECPFCAKMNAQLFPAVLDRYKNQVRVVYRDFPLDQHPWAMHAAVDANCLAMASPASYWDFVDYVHAHADEMGGDQKTVVKANQTLDKLVLDEGTRQKLNQPQLEACVQKQDESIVKASIKDAEALPLEVNSTPVLFINGEKVEGVQSMDTLYRIIDEALVAAGQTPPPPPPASLPPVPPAGAAKPGS